MMPLLTVPALLLLAGCGALAFDERISVMTYTVPTEKVTEPIRLLHLSDLHSSRYGKDQKTLLSLVEGLTPDVVLLTGDIADDRVSNRPAECLTEALASRYPCYYVSGNHELYTGRLDAIKDTFSSYGVTVLSGEGRIFTKGDTSLLLCGIDDPYAFPDKKRRLWEDQLADVSAEVEKDRFSILLTHRPELFDFYAETPFDLILAGHAHGGQVRLPGLLNGLYAPHQGWFPKKAGGDYLLREGQRMIVSRGLSKHVRPRVFNRPECSLICLMPEETQ